MVIAHDIDQGQMSLDDLERDDAAGTVGEKRLVQWDGDADGGVAALAVGGLQFPHGGADAITGNIGSKCPGHVGEEIAYGSGRKYGITLNLLLINPVGAGGTVGDSAAGGGRSIGGFSRLQRRKKNREEQEEQRGHGAEAGGRWRDRGGRALIAPGAGGNAEAPLKHGIEEAEVPETAFVSDIDDFLIGGG